MSHWVRIQSQIKNDSILKKALTRLDWAFQEGEFTVSVYGQKEQAQISLTPNKDSCVLGLSKTDNGNWALVGDPYHADNDLRKYYGRTQNLMTDLQTSYAIENTSEKMRDLNFFCTDNAEAKVGSNGKIQMVFESY